MKIQKSILLLLFLMIYSSESIAVTDFKQISQQVMEKVGYNNDVEISFKINTTYKEQLEKENLELLDVQIQENANQDVIQLILIDKDTNKEYKISAYAKKFVYVLSSTKNIKQGDVIDREDLFLLKIPNNNAEKYLYEFPTLEEKKVAKHNLIAYKPIKNDDLYTPFTLQKGQKVKVLFKKHNLTIEAIGICLEAGNLDDMIKVKILESGKISHGSVVSNEVVLITTR